MQQNAIAQQVAANRPEPEPLLFTDVVSGEIDSVVTPGGVANVNGRRLKFDATDPEQGIFFVAADGSASRVETVAKNSPTS